MKWYYIFIVIPLALLIADYRTDDVGSTAAGVGDTANVLRAEIRDTASSVVADSGVAASVIGDTAEVVRANAADTSAVYAGDTATVVRGNISDTAQVYQGYIGDTATVMRGNISDSGAVFRAEMTDSAEDVWNDSASVMRGNINDTADILRAEMVDTATVYGNLGALGDSMAAMRQTAQTITATWKWDGGNIIAADGQKVIWTDDTEADSGSIYDAGDTTHITSDNPIRLGGAGKTTVDSLKVNGVVTGNFQVQDSLIIPTYAAFPATGSEGLVGADTANDSLIAYWGGARRVIFPSSGGGARTYYKIQMIGDSPWINCASGSSTWHYGILPSTMSCDTVVVDSIHIHYDTDQNDVYSDSIALCEGFTRTANSSTVLWGDGTDVGAGDTNEDGVSYTGLSFKMGTDNRPKLRYYVATSGTAGNGQIYSFIIYCHEN